MIVEAKAPAGLCYCGHTGDGSSGGLMYQVIEFNLDKPKHKWTVGAPVHSLEEARRIRSMKVPPRKKGDPEVRNIEEV